MVEFDFDLKPLFPNEVVKITSYDLRKPDCNVEPDNDNKISQLENIINHMGRLSAAAQDLKAPITTAEKLKFSENTKLYLMAKLNDRENDSVVGLLKVGNKDLYLYDELMQQRKVTQVPCILDFYIYESCQRNGYGKKLFETMLNEENWTPNKCSIDRPSEKLKGFLRKHYGLEKTIPQGYKFVLYKGFFDGDGEMSSSAHTPSRRNAHEENQKCSSKATTQKESARAQRCVISSIRTKPNEQKQRQASISLEHFGGCLDVYNIGYTGRCNPKLPKHCISEHPYSMVEVIQTLNKRC